MTPTDPTTPDTVAFGEPVPSRRFRRRSLVAGLATVAVLAAAATGVAMASTSTPSPSGSATGPGDQKQLGVVPGPFMHGPGGMRGGPGLGGGLAGMMGALHGEFVVPKQGGGYQTMVVQRGTVSEVSSSTITVKSADGFTATYEVGADALVNAARDGIGSIKKSDEVSVVAQQKSGNDAAVQIADLTRWKGLRDKFGPGHDRGPANGGPPTTDAPSPSTTGSTGSSSFGV